MAAYPIPVITPVAPIAYNETPQDVALSGVSSTAADGETITAWLWTLFDWPTYPTTPDAYILNPTTSTPTLKNVTVGAYGIHLKITDSGGNVSHAYWYPTQKGTAPYNFTYPLASSIATVSMLTEKAELSLVNRGARDWFGVVGGYWDLVRAVDTVYGQVSTGDGYFDHLYEKTLDHGITVHHTIDGETANFKALTVTNTAPAGDIAAIGDSDGQGFVAASYSVGNGGNRIQSFWDLWANAIAVREIRAGDAGNGVAPNGNLDIKADGVMTLDPGEGYIQAKTDFRVNAVTPIANNSGVTVTKRGTSGYDLKSDKIEAGQVNSVIDADLVFNYFNTVGSNNSKVTLKSNAVEIQGGVFSNYDLQTNAIAPLSNDTGLAIRGRGTHTADLFLDEMRSDTVGGALNINDVPHKSGRVDGIDVSRLGPEIRATDETLTNTTAAVQAYTTKITVTGGLQFGEVQEIEAAVFVNTMPDGGAVTVRVRAAGNAVLTGSYVLTADMGFIMRGELHVVSAGVYRLYGSVACTDDNSVTPMRAVDLGGVGSTYDITVDVQFGATGGANAATLELLSSRICPAYVAP